MRITGYGCVIIFISGMFSFYFSAAKTIHQKQDKFTVNVPDALAGINDTGSSGDMYYDMAAGIILMISERPSKFKSVKDYMDCSNANLENQLRVFYSDPSLTLTSCSRSHYYPKETVELNFTVSVFPQGFNTCLVFFIHHKDDDYQFSFAFNKTSAEQSARYIDTIMQSLLLK